MAIRFHLKSYDRTTPQTSSAGRSILSVRADELVERVRLLHAISELEKESSLQMRAIGELVYATHRGTPSDSEEMQQILEYLDDLNDEIEGHVQQLNQLEGIIPCPICGENTHKTDTFCQNCGQPLPIFPAEQS